MPSCSPIVGRIGEMIMIWLADENTSSQSVNTIRNGDAPSPAFPAGRGSTGGDGSPGGGAADDGGSSGPLTVCRRAGAEARGDGPPLASSPVPMDEPGGALDSGHQHELEHVDVQIGRAPRREADRS